MKYTVKKNTALYECLTTEERELRFSIVRNNVTKSGKSNYFTIESLRNDGSVFSIGALPNELEKVDITFGEEVTEQIEKELGSIFK